MKSSRISVRFPATLRRKLQTAARRSGLRESDLVRRAVEHQLAAQEEAPSAYERATKAGLIGIVRRARPDLSTNPKDFKGFGNS